MRYSIGIVSSIAICVSIVVIAMALVDDDDSGSSSVATTDSAEVLGQRPVRKPKRTERRVPPAAKRQRTRVSAVAKSDNANNPDVEWAALQDAMRAGNIEALVEAAGGAGIPDLHDRLDTWIDRYYNLSADDRIIDDLVSRTDYSRDELEQVDDLRAFMKRNTHLLVSTQSQDASTLSFDEFDSEILFSSRLDIDDAPGRVQTDFAPDTRIIYATFSRVGETSCLFENSADKLRYVKSGSGGWKPRRGAFDTDSEARR